MLHTLKHNYTADTRSRLVAVAFFVALMAVSAKIAIPLTPVPFTLQVLVVLLCGMVLGWRDALLAQISYVGLIALGLPIDANSVGSLALFGPTGGFLLGFIPAAGVTGYFVERAGANDKLWKRFLAGLVGVGIIYFFGAGHLMLYVGMSLERAYAVGVQPFIALDAVKALLAAGLAETMGVYFRRQSR